MTIWESDHNAQLPRHSFTRASIFVTSIARVQISCKFFRDLSKLPTTNVNKSFKLSERASESFVSLRKGQNLREKIRFVMNYRRNSWPFYVLNASTIYRSLKLKWHLGMLSLASLAKTMATSCGGQSLIFETRTNYVCCKHMFTFLINNVVLCNENLPNSSWRFYNNSCDRGSHCTFVV